MRRVTRPFFNFRAISPLNARGAFPFASFHLPRLRANSRGAEVNADAAPLQPLIFFLPPSYRANESRLLGAVFIRAREERGRWHLISLLDTLAPPRSREITFLESLERISEESLSFSLFKSISSIDRLQV